ncbi:class I SAM-dependent methyltransferase [Dyadobacter sp. CY107]|uniref:class I SAM-dependent methyltransferase n=1 Tax=Dyadobacter fanqingshengii TaxID=2906443 RepID=UPI001F2DC49F|nr:class I SAM-dependent methyltransferase [Dyadobacter fanqingshengii]MCF2502567.1 class I SAM-dependent methyltransferase [Dyadobacter fanqingshengii]
MKSKITGGETEFLFSTKVLHKYDVKYFQCQETGFIQTEDPYWLAEAYQSAITKLDVGLVHRNVHLADLTEKLLIKFFNYKQSFLDYAGGYGLFTRIMRDKGFKFFSTDKFCQNLFAEYFDLAQLSDSTYFELVTAFEVFEHLANPLDEIGDILRLSDNVLFTTELIPDDLESFKSWYYLSPETGQHISFYNLESLKYLAMYFGRNLYTNGKTTHLFTKRKLASDPFFAPVVREPFLLRKARKYVRRNDEKGQVHMESLIGHDWNLIKDKLNS